MILDRLLSGLVVAGCSAIYCNVMGASMSTMASDVSACPLNNTPYVKYNKLCDVGLLSEFTELQPGASVAAIQLDYRPLGGIGFWPKVFATAESGSVQVYDISRPQTYQPDSEVTVNGKRLVGDDAQRNVIRLTTTFDKLPSVAKFDLIWAAAGQYSFFGYQPNITASTFQPIHDALKPGGIFVLMDADIEVVCDIPTCISSHPRLLASKPKAEIASVIESAGFKLVAAPDNLYDSTKVAPGVVVGWGSAVGSHSVGYPFLWKFQRVD